MFRTYVQVYPVQVETASERRDFVCHAFLLYIIFLLLSLVHWSAFVLLDGSQMLKIAKEQEYTGVVLMFMSMLLLLLFSLSDQLRAIEMVNWVIGFVIVESEILAIGLLAVHTNIYHILACYLVLTLLLVFAILISLSCPNDFTVNIYTNFTFTYCAFLLSIHAALCLIIIEKEWYFYLYAGVICVMAMPVLVYHMQCILATGLVRVHVRDTLLAGLIMFNDFVALFMLTFYWRPSQAKQ